MREVYPGTASTLRLAFRAFTAVHIENLEHHLDAKTKFCVGTNNPWAYITDTSIGPEVAANTKNPEKQYEVEHGGDLIFSPDPLWELTLKDLIDQGGGKIPCGDQKYGLPCCHYERAIDEATQRQVRTAIRHRIKEVRDGEE